MSISESFSTLVARLAPTQNELDAAKRHLDAIQSRLEKEFAVSNCRIIGSFARGTSIRGFSDSDLLAVFRKEAFTWGGSLISSDTAISNVRVALAERYPNSNVGRDGIAVAVTFSDGRHVDVVPAIFHEMRDKLPVYRIPDNAGGWMETCPALHDAYLKLGDEQSGGRLSRVARLMKFWCRCRTLRVPLSSFHIEMVLASEAICKGVRSYAECVRDILRSLAQRECRAIRDPMGISGYIPAVKTPNQRESALTSVTYSRDHANSAVSSELYQPVEARRQWGIVFNGNFPA